MDVSRRRRGIARLLSILSLLTPVRVCIPDLSNHAKHAIVALDRLGAPEDRVQEYWDSYTELTPYKLSLHRLEKDWAEVEPCTSEQWEEWRGRKIHWQEQVKFMNEELKKYDRNTDKLVQKYFPDLLPGVAGALTHGIIHLGWAIDAGSPWMITEGLAYLNFCYIGVDQKSLKVDQHEDLDPMDSFRRVALTWEAQGLQETWIARVKATYDKSFHPELVPAGFQWELSKVLKEPHVVATELPTWLNKLSDEDLWEAMYRATVHLYLATRSAAGDGNFLVLHLITSLWALEKTVHVTNTGKSDTAKVTRKALSVFYATTICLLSASSSGFPSATSLENIQQAYTTIRIDPDGFNWGPIVERGIAEEEEHNIKLVYVMKELWGRYGRWSGFSAAADSFTLTPNIGPTSTTFKA